MKKFLLSLSCVALSAALAQSQTQSGTSSSGQATGQSGNTSGQQQTGTSGQIDSQQRIQPRVTVPGVPGVIVNDPAGNQNTGLIPGGDTNRIPFGGTNQVPFGGTNQVPFGRTNSGTIINDPSGVNVQPPVPFGANTGVDSRIQPPAPGADIIQRDQNGNIIRQPQGVDGGNRVTAANDALFAQQLNAALTRGGATKVFFPQTRSTITIVNQNGSIMLQGLVSSEVERQQIEARVKNSAGVTSVNNQLKIAPSGQAPSGQNRAISPNPNTAPANENQRQLLTP